MRTPPGGGGQDGPKPQGSAGGWKRRSLRKDLSQKKPPYQGTSRTSTASTTSSEPGRYGMASIPTTDAYGMPDTPTIVRQAMSVRDEGRSLGAGLRRQAPNHRERLGSRAP